MLGSQSFDLAQDVVRERLRQAAADALLQQAILASRRPSRDSSRAWSLGSSRGSSLGSPRASSGDTSRGASRDPSRRPSVARLAPARHWLAGHLCHLAERLDPNLCCEPSLTVMSVPR